MGSGHASHNTSLANILVKYAEYLCKKKRREHVFKLVKKCVSLLLFHILYTLAVIEVDTENLCIWFHDQNNDPVLSPDNISLQNYSNITTECFCC